MTKKLSDLTPTLQKIYGDAIRQQFAALTTYRAFIGPNDEPTPEDRERWRDAADRERIYWADQWLIHVDDPVLELHSPDSRRECMGCDFQGFEGEPPNWPCRTVKLIITGDPDFEVVRY